MNLKEITQRLQNNDPRLKTLKLRRGWRMLSRQEEEKVKQEKTAFFEALAKNTTLESLDIGYAWSSQEDMACFAQVLRQNKGLKKVTLNFSLDVFVRAVDIHFIQSIQENQYIERCQLNLYRTPSDLKRRIGMNPLQYEFKTQQEYSLAKQAWKNSKTQGDIFLELFAGIDEQSKFALSLSSRFNKTAKEFWQKIPFLEEVEFDSSTLKDIVPADFEGFQYHPRLKKFRFINKRDLLEKARLEENASADEKCDAIFQNLNENSNLTECRIQQRWDIPIDDYTNMKRLAAENQWLCEQPKKPWPRFKQAVLNLLLFIPRFALLPITLPFGLFFTRFVTQSRRYPLINFEKIESLIHNVKYNPTLPAHKIEQTHYTLEHPVFIGLTGKKSKETPVMISKLTLRNPTRKLHINLSPAQNDYMELGAQGKEKKAMRYGADQWCLSRNSSWTLKGQTKQIRMVIAAAIEAGYKDIRLDGFSYGAGLARTAVHEIMADKRYRSFLQEKGVILHYTARNGYTNEMTASLSFLLRSIFSRTPYATLDAKQSAIRPHGFISTVGKIFHALCLFNFSVEAKKIHGYQLDPNSRNYHVNAMQIKSGKKPGELCVAEDDDVLFHEPSNDIERYGHSRIEVFSEEVILNNWRTHGLGMAGKTAKMADEQILRDLYLSEHPEEAQQELAARQKQIFETNWKTVRGKKVEIAQADGSISCTRMPKHVVKQLDVTEAVYNETLSPSRALIQFRSIAQNASEKSIRRRAQATQDYYQSFRGA